MGFKSREGTLREAGGCLVRPHFPRALLRRSGTGASGTETQLCYYSYRVVCPEERALAPSVSTRGEAFLSQSTQATQDRWLWSDVYLLEPGLTDRTSQAKWQIFTPLPLPSLWALTLACTVTNTLTGCPSWAKVLSQRSTLCPSHCLLGLEKDL